MGSISPPPLLPTVDLSEFLNSENVKVRKQVATELADACHSYGAAGIIGHGIPSEMIAEAFALVKKFFDLPLEDKMKAPHPPALKPHRGYSYPGMESAFSGPSAIDDEAVKEKGANMVDYKENFDIGSKDNHDQENIWPPEDLLPGFRSFAMKFFDELNVLCFAILEALIMGLDLNEEESAYTRGLHLETNSHLRYLHYPPISTEDLKNDLLARLREHTDFTVSFTIIFQDSCGGLEFANPAVDGQFLPAIPDGDKLYLNIGDMFMRLSNGYYRSALHRVIVPERVMPSTNGASQSTESRYSIPYFFQPERSVILSPQPSCIAKTGGSKEYEDITPAACIEERGKWMYDKKPEE